MPSSRAKDISATRMSTLDQPISTVRAAQSRDELFENAEAKVASTPLVVCVILNTNRRKDTLECLASLEKSTYRHFRVIVLDCQSIDGSVAAFRSAFPAIQIIELAENLGYAGNNNVGIREGLRQGADWLFVLNEDTVLAPDCLQRLVEMGLQSPDIGIVGPMIYHHDEPEVIQSAGAEVDRWWRSFHLGQNQVDRGQFGEPRNVRWISGCAILVRSDVVHTAGALDERFFIYCEEVEWCIRAGKSGWRIVHVPSAKLWHKGVQRHYQPKPAYTYYTTRNRLLMLSKHHAPTSARFLAWLRLIRTLASWTLRPKWRNKIDHRDAMWRGMKDFLRKRWGQIS